MKLDGYTVRAGDKMWDLAHGSVTVIGTAGTTVEVKNDRDKNLFYERGLRADNKQRMLYWGNPVLVPVPKDLEAVEAARDVTKALYAVLTKPS